MRIVVADPDSCVACRNCEYACAFRHTGDFDRSESRISVSFYALDSACVPLTCMHCGDAACEQVCPAGAISRDEQTGAVLIDQRRCVGCKMCMLACPFGHIRYDAVSGVSRKCDLCDGDPHCVGSCTSGALQFVEAEDAAALRREAVEVRLRRALHLDRGGRR